MSISFDSDQLHFYLKLNNAFWIVSIWRAIQSLKLLPLLYIAYLIPI